MKHTYFSDRLSVSVSLMDQIPLFYAKENLTAFCFVQVSLKNMHIPKIPSKFPSLVICEKSQTSLLLLK